MAFLIRRPVVVQFELTHYGQTRILANASPHASVAKPAKGASASMSAGARTSNKLTASGPSADVAESADANSFSPDVAVGAASATAAAAAAGVAVGAYSGKGEDADYDGPGMEGGAEIDVPHVQLDTPGGSGAPTPVPNADVSGEPTFHLLSSPAPACDSCTQPHRRSAHAMTWCSVIPFLVLVPSAAMR